jgi:predicted nucleotidyltransferase component of viral defense system
MQLPELLDFRLVGGTALSLLRGHRISEDIDLFTHRSYGSVNFEVIETVIRNNFTYVYNTDDTFPELKPIPNNYGLHLNVGENEDAAIKVDILNWTDEFLYPYQEIEGIRIASLEEIALMKLDTISRGGRKKDFWDLSEILETHDLTDLLARYKLKYPYYDITDVINGLTDFSNAEEMPDPICLNGKFWEIIKEETLSDVHNVDNTKL